MKKMLMVWFADSAALWFADAVLEGISFADTKALVMTALVLAVLNAVVKPVLKLLSFPITLATMGLFSLVINGAVLMMAFNLSEGSQINGIGTAILAAVIVSVIGGMISGSK